MANPNAAGAEYSIRADHATSRYSSMSPPMRSVLGGSLESTSPVLRELPSPVAVSAG